MKIPLKLTNAYDALITSSAANDVLDTGSLLYFQTVLNSAQPQGVHEQTQQNMIRLLYSNDQSAFRKFLTLSSCACYVLWLDAKSIIGAFRFSKKVHIIWNNVKKKYVVSMHVLTRALKRPVISSIYKLDDRGLHCDSA
jgi:hypothetical protein